MIVEDEPPARGRLRRVVAGIAGVAVVGLCATGQEAVRAIQEERPDLVLLDVQLPGLDGFGVIDAVGADRMPAVVFVTAYDRYAVAAFGRHALDYLLKPFDDARLVAAVERARAAARRDRMSEFGEQLRALLAGARGGAEALAVGAAPAPTLVPGAPYLDRIAVRDGARTRLVPVSAVDWIEGARKHAVLHVGAQACRARVALHALEVRLDPRRFVRIHKSVIVRVDRIAELRSHSRGDHVVVLADGTELRLSRARRPALEAALGQSW